MKKISKFRAFIISVLALLILIVLFLPSRTSSIRGENSIAIIENVELGKLKQFIMVRGNDKSNPIILFLHGGPGYSQISYARKYQEKLEQDFIVVNWDQRGSGKSYQSSIPKATMNKEQFISDTKQLIDYLCENYNKEKIYLAGHSWGSELGLNVIEEYPDKIIAFISLGQVVNQVEGERISYNYTLQSAKKNNNEFAINELENIGVPPYKDVVKDKVIQQKWLKKFGGVETIDTRKDMIWASIFSKEYAGFDGIKLALGSKFTADEMWNDRYKFDAFKQIPKVHIPIYFCVGRHDYTTPFELIERYYEYVDAPKKELLWFEYSAHFPHFEEVDKFYNLMIRIKIE